MHNICCYQHASVPLNNKHASMSCEAQLTWKCLFGATFFSVRYWPVNCVRLNWFGCAIRVH